MEREGPPAPTTACDRHQEVDVYWPIKALSLTAHRPGLSVCLDEGQPGRASSLSSQWPSLSTCKAQL